MIKSVFMIKMGKIAQTKIMLILKTKINLSKSNFFKFKYFCISCAIYKYDPPPSSSFLYDKVVIGKWEFFVRHIFSGE